jgi:tetratricopeptide (TPR) repeat protein
MQLARARALCGLHRYAEAMPILEGVIAGDPQRGDAWCLLSAAQLALGAPDAALDSAKAALALTPDDDWPHRLASIALSQLRRRVARPRSRSPRSPRMRTHAHIARSLANTGKDPGDARAAAERALALAPHEAEAHLAAGSVAAAAKDRTEAEAAFRRALAIDPQNSAAHNELARLNLGKHAINNPNRLADAATGFATAVRSDPGAEVSRRNLDLVLHTFLSRISYFIFFAAYFVGYVTEHASPLAARFIPLAALLIPAIYAWQFVARLTVPLRRYLVDLVFRNPKIRSAAALELLATACLVAGALAPSASRGGFAGIAAVTALIGRVMLVTQRQHSARAAHGLNPRPALGTPVLWIIVAAFAVAALMRLYATSTSQVGIGGILVALVCAAASAATMTVIRRRSSRS